MAMEQSMNRKSVICEECGVHLWQPEWGDWGVCMAQSWWQWLLEILIKFVDLITFGKMLTSSEIDSELTINVKFSKELTIPVKITPEMTVHEIKEQLANDLNIPLEELRIIFAGKELLDQTILQVSV